MKKGIKEVGKEIINKEKKEGEEPSISKVEEIAEIEIPSDFKKLISKVLNGNFNLLSKRYGEKWKLTNEELEDLTNAYDDLARKYLPAIVGKFSIELNAIFCTGYILLKRIL